MGVSDLEVLIEFDWVGEHQGGDTLELLWCKVFLELFKIALQGLLIDK